MKKKGFFGVTVLSGLATISSSFINRTVSAVYPDILGCERSCETAAGGWPFPFVVDYPGLSPGGTADLVGALLGVDRLWFGSLAGTFFSWLIIFYALLFVWRLWRRES